MHISTLCCNPETACFRGCYWNLSCLSASRFSFSHWIWFDTHSPTILKGINTEQSSEGPMPTPRLQYFGHLMQRAGLMRKWVWCWERLKVGGEGGDRGWDGWMTSPTQWTWVWASSGEMPRTEEPGRLQSMGLQRAAQDPATKQQQQQILKDKRMKKMDGAFEVSIHHIPYSFAGSLHPQPLLHTFSATPSPPSLRPR